jgi:hypothetical protein
LTPCSRADAEATPSQSCPAVGEKFYFNSTYFLNLPIYSDHRSATWAGGVLGRLSLCLWFLLLLHLGAVSLETYEKYKIAELFRLDTRFLNFDLKNGL